jgi:putative transposase
MDLGDRTTPIRFVLHDRDAKFTGSYDDVFRLEGAEVILTPIRAPNANAHVERLISTLRRESLDWTLIRGRRHLDRTLRAYSEHYNRQRPHRALSLAVPDPEPVQPTSVHPRDVHRRETLGGLINEYHGVAA